MSGPALEVREGGARYFVQRELPLTGSFEMLATALQAVVKLRALITRLAVQGRLVCQEVGDVPTDLKALQRSAPAKLKSARPTLAFLDAIPNGWTLARLGDVFTLQYGSSLPAKVRRAGQVPVYGSNGVVGHHSDALVFEPSLVIGRKGSVGAVNVARKPFWPIDTSYFVTPPKCVALEFSHLLFQSLDLGKHDKATAIPGINRNDVYAEPVLVPPLAEQRRIVARVEELMKLCDALEQSGRLADEQHARLTSTLFDALAASESAHALAENWQRIAEHFDLLLDRPEAVAALEQTILQLAVRGLLVAQDAGDESAADLLVRIRSERDRLISEGQIRKDRPAPVPGDDALPCALPCSWVWARFGAVVHASEAGWSPNCEGGQRAGSSWGVLKVSAVSWGEFRSYENKELPRHLEARIGFEVRNGDFLISRANTAELVARSVVVSHAEPRLMMSDKIIRLRLSSFVDRQFFNLVNNSRFAREYYAANASGTSSSMKNVGREVILGMPVPVPPLAEQHRIVARVEELRLLCTQLRERLSDARRTQSQLADALVAEVLA